jgi:hypothetical protein
MRFRHHQRTAFRDGLPRIYVAGSEDFPVNARLGKRQVVVERGVDDSGYVYVRGASMGTAAAAGHDGAHGRDDRILLDVELARLVQRLPAGVYLEWPVRDAARADREARRHQAVQPRGDEPARRPGGSRGGQRSALRCASSV